MISQNLISVTHENDNTPEGGEKGATSTTEGMDYQVIRWARPTFKVGVSQRQHLMARVREL